MVNRTVVFISQRGLVFMRKNLRCGQTSCFANYNGCTILREHCKRDRCPFFKTQEQFDADNIRAKYISDIKKVREKKIVK